MRRAVREQVRAGADLIKIMGCHDTLEFTDEELDAVVDETHRNGLKITAHATFDACIRRMLEHGVDTIEHGGAMSDETIQLLVDRGTYIITTFAPLVMQAEHGEAWGMPAWKVEERKRAVADTVALRRSRARRRSAGVPIVFGTDAGSPVVPHDVIAPELEFMVKLGVCTDNEHALRSITSLSAQMNDLQDDRGRLARRSRGRRARRRRQPARRLDAVERSRPCSSTAFESR